MFNIPDVKLGVISVSRDCFVLSLSERRVNEVVKAVKARHGLDVTLGHNGFLTNSRIFMKLGT